MTDVREQGRRRLLWLLWLYFALLVLEGVLRKWIVPEWSDVMLVVRDPIAAAVVFFGARDGYLPWFGLTRMLAWLLVAFTALGALQVMLFDLPLAVLAFGLRTYFLHPPVMFVMACVLEPRDVRRVVLATVVAAVPIAWLMAQQFVAGPLDWINRGAGEGRLQIVTSLGRIRPAGPFSFISGPIFYFALAMACLVASHLRPMRIPFVAQACGWGALITAAAVSGSRALIAGLIPVALAAASALVRRPTFARGFARSALIVGATATVVWGFTVVQEGLQVLDARMIDAGGGREVILRSNDVYETAAHAWSTAPLLGLGLGLGTNAGNALLGASGFRFGESEWTRILFEAGPILGAAYLLWRVWLFVRLMRVSITVLSAGEVLPLVLAASACANMLLGPWGQPTTQGFAVWAGGLAFAACRAARA